MKYFLSILFCLSLTVSMAQNPSAEQLLNIVNYRLQDCRAYPKINPICEDCELSVKKDPYGVRSWYLNNEQVFFFTYINPNKVIMLKSFTTGGSSDLFKGYYTTLMEHFTSNKSKVVKTDSGTNFTEKVFEYIVSNRTYHISLLKRKHDSGYTYSVSYNLDKY